jgi:glycosyltransferase involved in cell wall biosynthesis
MRILLDPQIFFLQRYGGISRYYTEMYRLLKNDRQINIKCPLLVTENLHLRHYNLHPKLIPFLSKIKGMSRFLAFDKIEKSKKITKQILEKKRADVFIPTYYDTYFLSSIGNIPFVVTVYDMIHELLPEHFKNDINTVPNKKKLIEQATGVIAISENTKRDILKVYPHIDANKIHVVYLSQSINTEKIKMSNKVEEKYVLFVGVRAAYKNFDFFLKATARWLLKNEMRLYCLGGGEFNKEELLLMESLGISNNATQIEFKDNELAVYYTNAFAFVFPSAYEGFGIPVLESMACGCPVILPNTSSFPEVAEDAGIYFELNNASSLVEKLQDLLTDDNLRQEKINLGFKQEKKFSWERTKRECLEVYKKAMSI